jgi:hypothetical protein
VVTVKAALGLLVFLSSAALDFEEKTTLAIVITVLIAIKIIANCLFLMAFMGELSDV